MPPQNSLETKYKGKMLEVGTLPALPVALQKAMGIMQQPHADMRKVAAVFAQDQVLSVKVLKLVNSPVYGFPGRIFSIQNALTLLGFNIIRSVIISTVVMENMPPHMHGLWKHSVGVSTIAKTLALYLNIKESNEYALAGLLHDLGKVILSIQLPDAYKDIADMVEKDDVTFRQAENALLGFDHAQINAWVADNWNLPPSLKIAMNYHHLPMDAPNYQAMCCVVHLADFMVRLFEYGFGGDNQVPYLEPRTLKVLDVNQRTLSELVDRAGAILYALGEGDSVS